MATTVYWAYFIAGRGFITLPLILLFIILMQTSQIMNSYTLVWWEAKYGDSHIFVIFPFTISGSTWNRPDSFYQTLYGCLSIAQAITTFLWYVNST